MTKSSPQPTTIAEAIQAELDRRQVSQRTAATELGLSQQSFSKWVNGTHLPRPEYREQLARFLRLKLADYDDLRRASLPPRRGQKTADRLTALENRVETLERLAVQIAARVGVEQ